MAELFDLQFDTIDELAGILQEWTEAFGLGFPQVPDEVYDHYRNMLKVECPDHDFLTNVGSISKRNKEILPVTMGSLRNKTAVDIEAWLAKYSNSGGYILSYKLDGVGIMARYQDLDCEVAWLRGDGSVGENITEKAKVFLAQKLTEHTLPTNLRELPKEKLFTGEMLLDCDPAELGYKNRRNAVSGIIHREDGKNLEHIMVLMHGWRDAPKAGNELWRMGIMNHLIPTVPFRYISDRLIVVPTAEEMIAEETSYDKDGIVIGINNSIVENVKFPEAKIAFKFNKQIAETYITWIEWNVSRTAKIIPLVYIDPVDLGGVTIGKCTAFNAKFVKDKGLGLAATIKVCRSGDVIPYIEEVINASDIVDIPTKCPTCDSPVKWDATEVHIECTNSKCPPVIQKKIAHFFLQLGLEFFSEKMISSLKCNNITDVYKLKEDDILKLEGWGKNSTKDFIKRIQDTKETTPDKLLASLGIHGFGGTLSKLMLDNFTFNQLINLADDPLGVEKLVKIKGVGAKRAVTLLVGLRESKDLLQELSELGLNTKVQEGGTLSGLKFEFTGSLSRPRKEIINWLEQNGGRHTSIGSADHLVANEPSDKGKYKKAIDLGKSIITEEQLVKLHFDNKKK